MAKATKTSLENKHLGNGDYFVIIAFSSHPLFLTEHAGNGLVEVNIWKVHVVIWQTTSNNSTKFQKRATRLSFLIPPTITRFSGVVFAVSIVLA